MRASIPCLNVCVTCRAGRTLAEGEAPPGRLLHDALADLLGTAEDAALRLRPVQCLASCERGCAAAMTAPGKWGYLLGGLHAGLAADLLEYGAAYARSGTGTVMPSRRPASLGAAVLGRIPALDQMLPGLPPMPPDAAPGD